MKATTVVQTGKSLCEMLFSEVYSVLMCCCTLLISVCYWIIIGYSSSQLWSC